MYPSVAREIPKFIEEYLVFCDCFIDIKRQKTCWVLTKNLKFFEFCKKQLVASIDLQTTCLTKIRNDIQNYNGPKGKWYEASNITHPTTLEDSKNLISMGKYVFHALNILKVYILIQCWDKCIVLWRLPDYKGFQIKAEYEDILSYRIVHGSLKYCAEIEFTFKNHNTLKTDFEEKLENSSADLDSKQIEMSQLLERIRSAKTELQLHNSITAQAFHKVQNILTMGQPFLRSFKLEEKQILSRCGDIWKRFTPHEDLVIGVPLVNQCSAPNLCIIRNLTPILQGDETPNKCIQLEYRIFQLKLKFDQLDDVASFLESEDEELQGGIWYSNSEMKIIPESFVVLLIKLKLCQIIHLKQSPLFLNYEVVKYLENVSESDTFTMPLQLFLQNLDFHKLLFEERSSCQLKFLPHTLHQDFLTIAMTSQQTDIKIIFGDNKDLEVFEYYLQKNLEFLNPKSSLDKYPDNIMFHVVFYNNNPSSLWFGSLVLRMKDVTEEDNGHYATRWKIYCQNSDKTLFFIKTLLNDFLTLQCNIISITNNHNDQNKTKQVIEFENALRQELQQMQKILDQRKKSKSNQKYLEDLEKLFQLQMNSDIKASNVISN
ncbi:uncharacterized protein ACRADG_006452 [Cochliomyia hominivorax]